MERHHPESDCQLGVVPPYPPCLRAHDIVQPQGLSSSEICSHPESAAAQHGPGAGPGGDTNFIDSSRNSGDSRDNPGQLENPGEIGTISGQQAEEEETGENFTKNKRCLVSQV